MYNKKKITSSANVLRVARANPKTLIQPAVSMFMFCGLSARGLWSSHVKFSFLWANFCNVVGFPIAALKRCFPKVGFCISGLAENCLYPGPPWETYIFCVYGNRLNCASLTLCFLQFHSFILFGSVYFAVDGKIGCVRHASQHYWKETTRPVVTAILFGRALFYTIYIV